MGTHKTACTSIQNKGKQNRLVLKGCPTAAPSPLAGTLSIGTSPDPCSSQHLLHIIHQQEGATSRTSLKIIQLNLSLLHQIFFPCNFTTSLLLCEENVKNHVQSFTRRQLYCYSIISNLPLTAEVFPLSPYCEL